MWHFRHDRTLPAAGPGRSLALWPLALGALLGATAAARADRLPPDPVQELRRALQQDKLAGKNAAALEFRKTNLEKRIADLKNLGDMSRALMLLEWRTDDLNADVSNLDQEMWIKLAERFGAEVRATLEKGEPVARRATADLLGEMAVAARASGVKALPVRGLLTKFGGDLAKAVEARDQESAVREAAARALGKVIPLPPEAAVKSLRGLLASPNLGERRAAAQALSELVITLAQSEKKAEGDRPVDQLPDAIARICANVVPAATAGLGDPDGEVRRLCVEAIRQSAIAGAELIIIPPYLDFPPPGRPLTADDRDKIEAYQRILEADRNRLRDLTAALRDATAAKGGDGPRLAQLVGDPDPAVRLLARRALEDIGYVRFKLLQKQATVPALPPATEEDKKDKDEKIGADPPARKVKASRLVRAEGQKPPRDDLLEGLEQALPALAAGLLDANPKARLAAVEAMEMLGAKAAPNVPALARSLADPDKFVRWAAARTLGKIGPADEEQTVPALARLLRGPDLDVQLVAAAALEQYGPAAKAAVPDLARAVGAGDAEARLAALKSLVAVGTDAEPALPQITAGLFDRDARVRKGAADALARFGPRAKDSVPALRQALNDKDPAVRRAASDALLAVTTPS